MAKGTTYGPESIEFVDPQSGAEIVQLTSNPTISHNLYMENCSFTPDSKRVIFLSRRSSERSAPFDLFRVDVSGRDLVQLTEHDDLTGAVLSLDGKTAFVSAGNELRSVDLEDFGEKVLARLDGASVGNPSVGGNYVFGRVGYGPDSSAVIRCNVDGSDFRELRRGTRVGHINASRTGNWVAWIETAEINEFNTQAWYVMRADGSDNHRWAVQNWAHSAWVGATDRMQGTLLPPGHGIVWCSPEDRDPSKAETICTGPYFWHAGASLDGEWIVSDTNWPDIGLQLVHLPSGRFQTVCLSQSSNAGGQHSHPHPSLSPDSTKVLYNSDRTGIPQVYVANVPEYLQDEVRTGKLLRRHRVGPRRP